MRGSKIGWITHRKGTPMEFPLFCMDWFGHSPMPRRRGLATFDKGCGTTYLVTGRCGCRGILDCSSKLDVHVSPSMFRNSRYSRSAIQERWRGYILIYIPIQTRCHTKWIQTNVVNVDWGQLVNEVHTRSLLDTTAVLLRIFQCTRYFQQQGCSPSSMPSHDQRHHHHHHESSLRLRQVMKCVWGKTARTFQQSVKTVICRYTGTLTLAIHRRRPCSINLSPRMPIIIMLERQNIQGNFRSHTLWSLVPFST